MEKIKRKEKTVIIGGLLIIIALLLIGAGAYAYFSDTETSTNTLTAGTIDLMVNNQNPWSQTFTSSLANLVPGETKTIDANLTNVGNRPMDVWVLINNVGTATPVATTGPQITEPPVSDIDDVCHYGVESASDSGFTTPNVILNPAGYTISSGSGPHSVASTKPVAGKYIYIGTIAAGQSTYVRQTLYLDSAITNWAQGDSMTFNIVFYALQHDGSPTQPTPTMTP